MLVRVGGVVLLGHVVEEEEVGEGLEPVRERAADVDRDRVSLADVLGEGLAACPVEHDDARRALEAGEEVVLPSLVVVQAADHPFPGKGEVRLSRGPRQGALTVELGEPPALVGVPAERDAGDAFDHAPASALCARTKSFTS